MTAIGYPDCEALSDNGRFRLEARSPHNGTIPHRNGQMATDDEYGFKYRDHQDCFRYQLLDVKSGEVLWERWQGEKEDSPHELAVSDEGWSILRMHGVKPEVLTVSPMGRDVLRVWIGPCGEHPFDRLAQSAPVVTWSPDCMELSSAGNYWTHNSWRYFSRVGDERYFVWRTRTGGRLVINLARAKMLLPEEQEELGIISICEHLECEDVFRYLSEMDARMPEIIAFFKLSYDEQINQDPAPRGIERLTPALALAGQLRIESCIPFLKKWEAVKLESYQTGSFALVDYNYEAQYIRPIVCHALRRMNQEPSGYAACGFVKPEGEKISIPEHLGDRREQSKRVSRSTSALEVLQLIGAPDFVSRNSRPGPEAFIWTETWEYDFREQAGWVTLRIIWEEQDDSSRMSVLEEVDATDWAYREAELFRD